MVKVRIPAIGTNTRAKLVPGTSTYSSARDRDVLNCVQSMTVSFSCCHHDPQTGPVLTIHVLTQQTNPFLCYATSVSVRVVLGNGTSQWNSPCSLTLKGTPRSDWLRTESKLTYSFRDKCTILGDNVLRDGPEANSTHVDRNHLTKDILSLMFLSYFLLLDVSRVDSLAYEVVLYFY